MEIDLSNLHIGDIISLYTENKACGFITTLGLVDTRCVVQQSSSKESSIQSLKKDLRDSLFKVLPQHRYSAQKQYRKTLLQKNKTFDESTLTKLQNAAESEKEQNEQEAARAINGNTYVQYGDVVQFLHLKSNRFLTVDKFSANVEKIAMRVYLTADGDEGSWFLVQPYYKLRSIGQNVLVGDRVVLQSVLGLVPLHASEYSLPENSHIREVNCRLLVDSNPNEIGKFMQKGDESPQTGSFNNSLIIQTSWKIVLYMTYREAVHENLKSNSTAETVSGNLETSKNPHKSWKLLKNLYMLHRDDKKSEYLKSGDIIQLYHVEHESYVVCREDLKCIFMPSIGRVWSTSAKTLWEVEVLTKNVCRGSVSKWNSLVRFKHLASGLYLSASLPDGTSAKKELLVNENGEKLTNKLTCFLISSSQCDDSTLFQLESTTIIKHKEEAVLQNSYARIKHWETDTWLHFTDMKLEMEKNDPILYKIGCSLTKKDNQAFKLVNISTTEIRNLDFVSDIAKLLKTFTIKIKENQLISQEKNALEAVLVDLILFLAETTLNKFGDNENGFDPVRVMIAKPNRARQELMREQLILDELFNIMKAPFIEFDNPNGIKLTELKKQKHGYQYMFKLCYRIIKHSQLYYKKNQEYICKYYDLMQNHIGFDVLAEETLIELFHSNHELLKQHITFRQIDTFVSLKKSNKDHKFLNFLTDLCVANGEVIPDVQDFICESILGSKKNSDILIETKMNESGEIFLSLENKDYDINELINSNTKQNYHILRNYL